MKTDLTHEISIVLDQLNTHGPNKSIIERMAEFLDVNPGNTKVLSFITFMNNQIETLFDQIKNSSTIDDVRKKRVFDFLRSVKEIFHPQKLNSQWEAERIRLFRPEYLVAISDLSDNIRPQFPMKVLTQEDIAYLRDKVTSIFDGLSSSDDTFKMIRDFPYRTAVPDQG